MNPLKHIFILILLLLAGLQVEAAHGEGSKTAGDFKYWLLNDSFSQPAWEFDLIANFRPNQELQKYSDTTSQYISPCDQILEEEAFTSPPGSLAPKVLCMLAEDLAKFPDLRKLFDSAENVGGKFVRPWEKLIKFGNTRKKIQWIKGFSKFADEGYQITENATSVIVKSIDDDVVEVVNDIPKLTKHKIVPKPDSEVIRKASDVNPSYTGWDPPYHSDFPAIDFKTVSNESFVRVFKQGSNSAEGAFVMKQSDILGLSPAKIKDKFALDFVPDKIADVNVPPNVSMRTGKVAPRPNGTSGGEIQFELREQISSSNFTNIRDL